MFKVNKRITVGIFSLLLILGIGVALQASAQLTAPALLSPANGATVSSLTTTLSWSSVSGATFYELKILKSTDAYYVYYYYISATNKTLTLTDNSAYNWAVHACETEFTGCSAWSSERSFTVQTTPTPTPTLTLSASSTQVSSGGSTTLSWSSTNATSCSASASPSNTQWSGSKTTSSVSQTITNLTVATSFVLSCTGAGGTASQNAIVTVSAISPTTPTLTFSVSPTQIASGQSVTLSWSSTNATYCSVNSSLPLSQWSQWSGNKSVYGTQRIDNITASVIFTMSCTGPGGTSPTKSVTVTVGVPSAVTGCDSTSFTSYAVAYNFTSVGGTISNVCGKEQYYKVSVPSGQTCNVKWTLQPDSNSDYDLYVKWGAGTLSVSRYDSASTLSKGLKDEVSKSGLSAGTYYALVDNPYPDRAIGSYSITLRLSNCEGGEEEEEEEGNPYISSIKVANKGSDGYIDTGDTITITFSEEIDPVSINDDLEEGDYVGSVSSSEIGGVAVSSAGKVTIKGIATFDMGAVKSSEKYIVKLNLSSSGKVLIITLTKGNDIKITDEKFRSATQIGGYIKDKDGDKMASDSDIDNPTGTFGGGEEEEEEEEEGEESQTSQLQEKINQILALIAQLQEQLADLGGGTSWCYTFKNILRYKDKGADVTALQTSLQKNGVYKGKIDGIFGTSTLEAVIDFQEKYKAEILTPWKLIRGTGFVGGTTLTKLNQLYGCK